MDRRARAKGRGRSGRPAPVKKVSFVRPRRPHRVAMLDATPHPVEIDLAASALLVIDMQNDFLAWTRPRSAPSSPRSSA